MVTQESGLINSRAEDSHVGYETFFAMNHEYGDLKKLKEPTIWFPRPDPVLVE
jgi:hypothetical protein